MSQLRESRRKEDFKYFLEVPAPSRPFTVDDIMHTRVTGQHQQWPIDADTTARIKGLTLEQKDDRRSIVMPLIGIVLFVGGLYGLILLWSSL